jgi:hypothetical protein
VRFGPDASGSLHLIKADAKFGNRTDGVERKAGVPLVLTQKGIRANVQNEIGPGSGGRQALLCEAPFRPFRQKLQNPS